MNAGEERGGGEEKEKAQCRRLQQRSDGGRSGALTGTEGRSEKMKKQQIGPVWLVVVKVQ